jgi:hypothetical protein
VTEAYLAACAEPDSPLRTAGRRLEFEHFFGKTWGARQLARPLFVPEHHLLQAAADVHALFELMFALPQRRYGGDLPRLCADLEMDERAAALACAAASGSTPLYTRPDLYYDGASFTLLETNTGTECGGVDAAAINDAYLALPEFREFADKHGLGYVDTGECIATYLRDLTGKPDPVVALIDIKLNFDLWYDYYRAFVAHMADRGIEIKVCHIADLGSTRGGKLTADGVPVDVTLRYFTLEELCSEPQAEEWLAPVLRAHVDGETAFIASLDYGIYSNKGVLAMVSELRDAGELAADEAAVVDRMLPWTRRVTTGLWEQCRAERDQLLLKPSVGGGGYGVTTGWTVTDDEWDAAFASALQTPYVVQRRADVILETVPDGDAGGAMDWLPAYGMFIFERGYAGSFIRTHPAAGRSVVNASTGATFTSVFSFPGSE